jgi:hypothetical protein
MNTSGPYVWNNWSWVIHTMSTWFWHKNRIWHSAADFDKSEWEIMYPPFVEEGIVDPSERVNRKGALCFVLVLWLSWFLFHLCCVMCLHAHICVFILLLFTLVTRIYVLHLWAGSLPAFEHLSTCLLWFDVPPSCSLSFCVRGFGTHLLLVLQLCVYVLELFAYQITTMLWEMDILFAQSCVSPCPLKICSFWHSLICTSMF